MGLTPNPHLVPKVLEKNRVTPLPTLRACVAYKKGENLPRWLNCFIFVDYSSNFV